MGQLSHELNIEDWGVQVQKRICNAQTSWKWKIK